MFNLKHFLSKRKKTLLEWLKENNIKTLEDYHKFIQNNQFVNDPDMEKEIKELITEPIEQLADQPEEVKPETDEVEKVVELIEEVQPKKKRLKPPSEKV